MRKLMYIAIILLLAGCTRQEEQDWIIGKWVIVSCTYVNNRTGERGDCSPGFTTWEFLERGNVIVDGVRFVPYWHKNGHVHINGTTYEEVAHNRDRMQLQHVGDAGVTTYTFTR